MNSQDNFSNEEPWNLPSIGQPLSQSIETREVVDPWLPAGLTLLAGKTKAGKSTFAEQIAEEVSIKKKVLYLALEYNVRTAQARFSRFSNVHQIHIVIEGQINRIGAGGERQFAELLNACDPALVVIDMLAKIKRLNAG